MSKNPLYANEIATAFQFVLEHNDDVEFMAFLADIRNREDLIHSDRWSLIYDYLDEHYPQATGAIVTGLSYYVED